MNNLKALIIAFAFLFCIVAIPAQDKNKSFLSGETLTYRIDYSWGVIWLSAGEVTFSANYKPYAGLPAYYFKGEGSTYPKYEWIYKVDDIYESYADTNLLKPYYFKRISKEGSYNISETAFFNWRKKQATTLIQKEKKPVVMDSVKISEKTIDVMTAIYYARGLDFSKCKPNDTIPITLYLENSIYPVYIRYIGKELKDIPGLGKFKCIKFKPMLVAGTIFKEGENMTVWVSDDKNCLPLYVETPILVGTIKVVLIKYQNIKFPMDARINP